MITSVFISRTYEWDRCMHLKSAYSKFKKEDLSWCNSYDYGECKGSIFTNITLLCVENVCFIIFSIECSNVIFAVFGLPGTITILFIYIPGDIIVTTSDHSEQFGLLTVCILEVLI
eukprot:147456_1